MRSIALLAIPVLLAMGATAFLPASAASQAPMCLGWATRGQAGCVACIYENATTSVRARGSAR